MTEKLGNHGSSDRSRHASVLIPRVPHACLLECSRNHASSIDPFLNLEWQAPTTQAGGSKPLHFRDHKHRYTRSCFFLFFLCLFILFFAIIVVVNLVWKHHSKCRDHRMWLENRKNEHGSLLIDDLTDPSYSCFCSLAHTRVTDAWVIWCVCFSPIHSAPSPIDTLCGPWKRKTKPKPFSQDTCPKSFIWLAPRAVNMPNVTLWWRLCGRSHRTMSLSSRTSTKFPAVRRLVSRAHTYPLRILSSSFFANAWFL